MNKSNIRVFAHGQRLGIGRSAPRYAGETIHYIEVYFDLDRSWEGYDSVRAVWWNGAVEKATVFDTTMTCTIPLEVVAKKGDVMVNLIASVSENGVLTDRFTSYPLKVAVIDADVKLTGSETVPVTPSQFEQFIDDVKDEADRAKSEADRAEQEASASAQSAGNSLTSAQASEASAVRSSNSASDSADSASASANSADSASQSATEAVQAKDKILGMRAEATTLAEGSQATASYSDGLLTLGIPRGNTGAKGDKGDKGNKGDTGSKGDTGNGIESIVLTSTSGAVHTYTITYTDGNTTTFDVTDGQVTDETLARVLESYAKVDGYYEDMSVGTANQLNSSQRANDKVPYTFRNSGGSVDIGDREYINGIVGGTVAWNQLIQNGNFANANNWGTPTGFSVANNIATYTPTADGDNYSEQNVSIVAGHKYLYSVYAKADSNSTAKVVFRMYYGSASDTFTKNVSNSDWNVLTGCFTAGSGTLYKVRLVNGKGNTTVHWKNVQLFDLTQMFGSTIADYICSLETATAGAGVAWFKKLFPKPYYAYNTGELMHVSGLVSHDTVGFNAWDEEWELGGINNANGSNVEDSTRIRSKNFIPVIGGLAYYFYCGSGNKLAVHAYDADQNYIGVYYGSKFVAGGNSSSDIGSHVITLPNDCAYLKIKTISSYGTTYNHDICINLSGSRNGEYEPYELHSYPLDSDLTLRGIPKLDANNNLYYDGDMYKPDGTVTRRYGIVDLGSLDWVKDSASDYTRFYTVGVQSVIKKPATASDFGNLMSKYTNIVSQYIYSASTDKCITVSTAGAISVKDSTYNNSDASAFKTAMSGVYLVYELATPTTETADPYQSPQIVDDFGTEEYVIENSIVPVGHDTDYPVNLRKKIEGLPWDFSTLIAPTEAGYKATRNYTTGALLIVNNILYKVIANIANGGTITPNTNVTATTLSEVISAL